MAEPRAESVQLKRRTGRWVLRAVGMAAMIVAIAYVSMPWWLPTGWIGRRFADVLSADLRRPVAIDGVEISWLQGITFRNVQISNPAAARGLLARIGSINAEFSPLTTLLTGEVDAVRFRDAEVFIEVDEAGRLNVADLGERRGGRLPSMNYHLGGLCIHVRTPTGSAAFPIDTVDCALNEATGVMEVTVQAPASRTQDHAPVATSLPAERESGIHCHAHVQVPRLKRGTSLGGMVALQWRNLHLADLPWEMAHQLPITSLSGLSTGQLTISTQPDLGMDFDFQFALVGVQFTRRDMPEAAHVPDAELHCQGRWDPSDDLLRLQNVDYRSPALHVGRSTRSDEPAVLLDPRGEIVLAVRLEGEVRDWQLLGQEIPDAAQLARELNLDLSGQGQFMLEFARRLGSDRLSLVLDGEQSGWVAGSRQPYWLNAGVGVPKRLAFELNRGNGQRSGGQVQVAVGPVSVLASTSFLGAATADSGRDGGQILLDLAPSLQSQWQIEVSRLEELTTIFPVLATYKPVCSWQGPLFAKATILPRSDDSRLECQMHLAAETALGWGELFQKPAGQPLSFVAGVSVPHDWGGTLLDPQLELNYQRSRCRLDGGSSRLQYAFGFLNDRPETPVGIEAHAVLPLRFSQVEDFLTCLPRFQRACAERATRGIRGSADITLHSDLFSRPGDWLIRQGVEFTADNLEIRWDGAFQKPAEAALKMTAEHQMQMLDGQQVQVVALTASQPAGEVSAGLCFASGDWARTGEEFEQSVLRADITELSAYLAWLPACHDWLADWSPSHLAKLSLSTLVHDGRQSVSVDADASGAGFTIPSASLVKPPGVPALGQLRWESRRAGTGDVQVWRLADASGQFAGVDLTELTGTITLDASEASARRWLSSRGRPMLRSARFYARGELEMDEPLLRLSPQLSQWRDELNLAGPVVWEGDLEVGGDSLTLGGEINAAELSCHRSLDSLLWPTFRKEAGQAVSASFDLSLSQWRNGWPGVLELNDLLLTVDGNSIQAWGSWPLFTAGPATSEGPEFGVMARLAQPQRLQRLLPGLWLKSVEGATDLRAGVRRDLAGEWRISAGNGVLDGLALTVDTVPLRLDGEVDFAEQRLRAKQFHWSWGQSNGTVTGSLEHREDEFIGQWSVACEHLDLPELIALKNAALPVAQPSTAPAATEREIATALVELLRQSQLRIDAHVGDLQVTLPPDISVKAEAVAQQLTVDRGAVNLSFNAHVAGGLVTGTVTSAMQENDPTLHLQYRASRIPPGPLTEAYLQRLFPGMKGSGPLTLIDESLQHVIPREGKVEHPTGKGELLIEGGSVEGRAAPFWMTRIFPGLNLAHFEFSYMHSWFEKFADGRIRHQMIYQGKYYNIYSAGYGDADGNIDYEVGIDFLADFDSKYWAESGQGRVPLFRKTGQVDAQGVLQNEKVVYVPRQFIQGVLVKNNPLVTAYHAVRKRVLGRK